MAKADLGTKRLCPNCGAKYYDLNKDPILCPKCGTPFEVTRPRAAPAKAVEDDEETPATEEAETTEFVSLEEADEEASGGATDDEEDADAPEDEKDAFLEVEDEEEGDVSDIIGDVDEEEQ